MSDTSNEFAGLSLMDLAGLDISGISAKRFGDVLPKMFADFECKKADLKELKDKDTDQLKGVIASFEWEVLGIHSFLQKDEQGNEYDPAAFVGKTHYESRVVQNTEGLQYLVGFLEDIGIKEKGALGVLVEGSVGRRIRAQITHRKDKNDADKVYSGLGKIKPIE